jgi:hypothetical protein
MQNTKFIKRTNTVILSTGPFSIMTNRVHFIEQAIKNHAIR